MFTLIFGFLINGLLIALFLQNSRFGSLKLKLLIISLISTIIVAIIPDLGYRFDNNLGNYYFGFPADIVVYRGDLQFSLASFGFLFNFFFFYWIFKTIHKIGVHTLSPLKKRD